MPFVKLADGRLQSPKIEFNLTDHCNYACAECSHLSPYIQPKLSNIKQFERDLQALAPVYRARRFRFVGGEPLLHRDILSFIAAVRASGIADTVQICTNGSLLKRVDDAVLDAIDLLSVSWYPDPRLDGAGVEAIRRRCADHGVRLKVEPITHFRQMNLEQDLDDETTDAVFRTCLIAHSWSCQTFYEGRFYLCSRPLFTGEWLKRRGTPAPDYRALDGIDLHAPQLAERLHAYLRREDPLESCRRCAGTVGARQPWRAVDLTERKTPAPAAPLQLSRRRVLYLEAWARLERAALSLAPSTRLNRVMQLVKNTAIGD